jgi:glycosyltransferase involved in cell wall biosynthesis
MSNAALEALVCGTPVIATAESGGIAELSIYTKKSNVTVTSTTDEFIQEMEKVRSRNIKSPDSSLLPPIYSMENSMFVECFLS